MNTTEITPFDQKWLDPRLAAAYIGTDQRVLARWATMSKEQNRLVGPKFATTYDHALNRELRIYRREWLDAFMEANYQVFEGTEKREQGDSHNSFSGISPPAADRGQGGAA